jgi:hypothetical protein
MTEGQLREFETATLGPQHAREHALMRGALREEKAEGGGETIDAAEPKLAAAAADVGAPEDVGSWSPNKTELPIVAIHAALLPTGKVMIFSYPTYPNRPNNAEAYLWDPAHPELGLELNNPPGKANIWCAGQTFTADGELVVFGGNLDYESPSQTWKGLDKVFTFNPWTETWREQPKMAHGRWYPTGVRMPDGQIPIVSGLDESGVLIPHSNTNPDIELFTPPDAPSGLGSIKKVGEIGSGDEQERAKKPIGQLYPRMVVMASGRTMLAGPDRETSWFIDNADPFTWGDIPNLNRHRTWGTTVPLPAGPGGPTKLLAIGGTEWSGEPSTTTTELFDEGNPGSWQLQNGKDNVYGRGHANTVLLPDGSMVEVGGGRGSQDNFESPLHFAEPEKRHIELWDPATGQWTLGPEQTEARAYHSTALLLPDARVMSAGDDFNGDPGKVSSSQDTSSMEDTAEIYNPPYLFRGGLRPSITSIATNPLSLDPSSNLPKIGYGGSFGVNTPNVNIASAALVAPGAVTHGVDMNQRMLKLPVAQRTGCVSVTAPTGRNAAPPGYYMLFLLNDQGVPSVAQFVKLEEGAPLGGCGTAAPPDVQNPTVSFVSPQAGAVVAGTVDVRVNATDDRGIDRVEFEVDGDPLATDQTSPYSTSWHTTDLSAGNHTITATAYDVAGKSTPVSRVVNVQNTDAVPPTVSITSPAPGTVTGDVTVAANATDDSGVAQVQFKVDGANIGIADVTWPFSVSWASINVPNGNHTLTAVARDSFGNERTSAGVSVNVQNQDGKPVDALPPKKTPTAPGETPGGGNGGGGGGGTGGGSSADAAPTVSKLRLSRASFRKGKATTISFRLSEPAKVALSFERALTGRRVRGRCLKPARGLRPNCTRYQRLTSKLTVQGKAGTNRVTFRGRVSRSRVLAVGRYRLTLVATDTAGKKSGAARTSFRLLDSAASARARAVRAVVLGWL